MTTTESTGLRVTCQTKVLWCDCIVEDFTWLRRSSSITTSTGNLTLCIFWRTGSLCTVCNCGHNTYQIAIVRHSLSLSCLRHNISSQWHDVSLLTNRGSEQAHSKRNELSQQKTLDVLFISDLFFFFCSFTPWILRGKCDCVRSHSD